MNQVHFFNIKTLLNNRLWLFLMILLVVLVIFGIAAWRRADRQVDSRSFYLTMRDGVKIAVDLYLPKGLAPDEQIPTMLRATPYWRSYQYAPIGKFIQKYGLLPYDMKEGQRWTDAGYALVVIDVRGSGASTGQWRMIWSQEEIADLGEVVDWIIQQNWSNGKVGAYGVSYDGNIAEMLAALNHPAVKAVAPQYNDYDLYRLLVRPGGVLNTGFMQGWNTFHNGLGANDICTLSLAAGVSCEQMKSLIQGVRPVDDDLDGLQLADAVEGHLHLDVFQIAKDIEFADDTWLDSGMTLGDLSPYSRQQAIQESGIPMYIWGSWLDSATIEGILSRYLTLSNPQTVIIGPWSHGGAYDADPFLPEKTKVAPKQEEQFQMLVNFFDAYLKSNPTEPPQTGITYYTMGQGTWKNSQTWPPEGVKSQRWYLAADHQLNLIAPKQGQGSDRYTVDWSASTGDKNRWFTGLFKGDVIYPDRALEDQKLLTYTTPPMISDTEITGSPLVTLYLSSTENDGAIHVYLEDVSPEGRVTYITEGILRLTNNHLSNSYPPYEHLGPEHSLLRKDSNPLIAGETIEIQLRLYATSVLIQSGHSIRLAIAGHDSASFERIPTDVTPELTIERSKLYPSNLVLPIIETQ